MPSPAFTTDVFVCLSQPASRCAAPLAGCRTITQSAPAACRVSAVSRSDSPLLTLEPLLLTLITSADIHLPAISKETRVRVLFS
jgi:hypothetical protein